MKCPSRRKSFPNVALSWTSTSWQAERNASSVAEERTKRPQSSVRCSVRIPGARSPGGDTEWLIPRLILDHFLAAAVNRLKSLATRLQRRLERLEHALGLAGVVGRVVADVHVYRHESRLGPRMDRQMRFGEEHRPG